MEKGDLLWAVISQDWASVVDAGGQKRSHSVRWSFSPVFIRHGPFFPGLGNSEGSLEQDKSLSASLKGLWTKETRKKYNTQTRKLADKYKDLLHKTRILNECWFCLNSLLSQCYLIVMFVCIAPLQQEVRYALCCLSVCSFGLQKSSSSAASPEILKSGQSAVKRNIVRANWFYVAQ